MGTSATIIACELGDFPPLSDAISLTRSGDGRGRRLPPVGYSEARGYALVWINQTLRDDLGTIDYAELSRIAPIWVLSVVAQALFSALERYIDGERTCALWASHNRVKPLTQSGEKLFDLDDLSARNIEYTRERNEKYHIDEEPDVFSIPLIAFRDFAGVEYDGEGSGAVEIAEATFPLEGAA